MVTKSGIEVIKNGKTAPPTGYLSEEAADQTNMVGPHINATKYTYNRETSSQIIVGDGLKPQTLDHWRERGLGILSIFVLRGSGILAANGNQVHVLTAGQHMMYRVPDTTSVTLASLADVEFQAIAFQYSEGYLRKHCPENCPTLCRLTVAPIISTLQPLGNGLPQTTRAEQRSLISQVMETNLATDLQPVYRDIKIAELLVLQLEEILYEHKENDGNRLHEHELQRVYQVRDILRGNPGKSYTLLGLAREVGTNDATLKKHFKLVLGTTVFAYLTTCRMEAAEKLLLEKRVTIAEIAQHLGYKYVSHFSAAFRKYYGVSPTKFLEMS